MSTKVRFLRLTLLKQLRFLKLRLNKFWCLLNAHWKGFWRLDFLLFLRSFSLHLVLLLFLLNEGLTKVQSGGDGDVWLVYGLDYLENSVKFLQKRTLSSNFIQGLVFVESYNILFLETIKKIAVLVRLGLLNLPIERPRLVIYATERRFLVLLHANPLIKIKKLLGRKEINRKSISFNIII